MIELILSSQQMDAPPSELSPPLQALWWLKKGAFKTGVEWEKAHEICQTKEGVGIYDWVHGLAHFIEGDEWNSDYWYRRCGQKRTSTDTSTEWTHIVTQLAD